MTDFSGDTELSEDARLCVEFFDRFYAELYRPEHHEMHRAEWATVPEHKPWMMPEIRRMLGRPECGCPPSP